MKKLLIIGLVALSSISVFAATSKVTIAGRNANGNVVAYGKTLLGEITSCQYAELIGTTTEAETALQSLKKDDVVLMSVSQYKNECVFFVRSINP